MNSLIKLNTGLIKAEASIQIANKLLALANIKTIVIGSQEWMVENLNVSYYRNGDAIPEAKHRSEWMRYAFLKIGCWCYYDNDPDKGRRYGKLYNWYAVNDDRGLAPEGWEIPAAEDYLILQRFLGDAEFGSKMKTVGGWKDSNNGTNESGWSALPGGARGNGFNMISDNGIEEIEDSGKFTLSPATTINNHSGFYDIGESGSWWTTTEAKNDFDIATFFSLNYEGFFERSDGCNISTPKWEGFSVRCIKKTTTQQKENVKREIVKSYSDETIRTTNLFSKIKQKIFATKATNTVAYKTITIGSQEWMLENLNISHYRNGDIIPEAKSFAEWEKCNREQRGCWCYYNNDIENGKRFGKLYNWYAVNDKRGIAPEGWHVPLIQEFEILINQCGGENVAGEKLKALTSWNDNGNGTNEVGWNALAGGTMESKENKIENFGQLTANSDNIGAFGVWWSKSECRKKHLPIMSESRAEWSQFSETELNTAWNVSLNWIDNEAKVLFSEMKKGYSVRCVKD